MGRFPTHPRETNREAHGSPRGESHSGRERELGKDWIKDLELFGTQRQRRDKRIVSHLKCKFRENRNFNHS